MSACVRLLLAASVVQGTAAILIALPPEAPNRLPSAGEAPAVAEKPEGETAAASADGYRLRYRFKTNDVVNYEVAHTMEITTRKDETSETASNESHAEKHYRVVSVDRDGNAILELMIDRVRMSARFGEADPVVFDSDKPSETPRQFAHVQKTVGQPLARIKVSASGEMLSVVDLLPELKAGESGDSDATRSFLIVFPERPVRVGDTWKDDPNPQVRVTVGKSLTRDVEVLRRYELVSVEGNLATIHVRNTVITPVRDPAIRAQLIQRSPEGEIVFDLENGLLVSRKMTIDKTEIGVFGDNSSMQAVSRRTETFIPSDAVAKKLNPSDTSSR